MDFKDISLPEVYTDSEDFRFFCKWFAESLEQIKYDTDNMVDLYDPLRCPADLLWALADTMGYTYDDRLNLPTSFNRLVLLNFMAMIYKRGSIEGVTLSAEVNLAQFNIMNQAKENNILYDRLDDTSIPANAVSVIPNTPNGFIDVVYFSTEVPVDACIEYTRPLGMFLFQHAGVKFNSRTKVSIDARLTNSSDIGYSPIAANAAYTEDDYENLSYSNGFITQVGQYSREDYARLQTHARVEQPEGSGNYNDVCGKRSDVWYRNSKYEQITKGTPENPLGTDPNISPGLRALNSLQLSNNENIVRSLLEPLFSIGYDPQSVGVEFPEDYLINPDPVDVEKPYNLRYDPTSDETLAEIGDDYIQTLDPDGGGNPHITPTEIHPYPAVNPVMSKMGDAISKNDENTDYYQPTINGGE